MQNAKLLKWVHLWTVAAATTVSAVSGVAQEAAPPAANTNQRKKVVVCVLQPNPSAIVTDAQYRYSVWRNIEQAQRVIASTLLGEVENQFRRVFEVNDRTMTNRILDEAQWKLMFESNGSANPLQIEGTDYIAGVYVQAITFDAHVESRTVDLGPLGKRRVNVVFAKSKFLFSVRLVDARTGRTLWDQSFEGEDDDTVVDVNEVTEKIAYDVVVGAARKAVGKMSEFLARKYPPMLKVLAVTPSGNYILGVGKREGIKPGDHLQLAQIQRIPRADGRDYITHQAICVVKVVSVNDEDACEVVIIGEANAPIKPDAEYTFSRTSPPKKKR